MKTTTLTIGALLLAGTASAAPITSGTWIPTPAIPCECGNAPWANPSWDGPNLNLGFWEDLAGMEYLHAPFRLPDTTLGHGQILITALPGGFLTVHADGALEFNNTIGGIFLSNGAGWQNFWVLRRPGATEGFVGVEDLPQGATDNDTDWRFHYAELPGNEGSRSIPEPASVAMMGLGLLAAARRLRRRG